MENCDTRKKERTGYSGVSYCALETVWSESGFKKKHRKWMVQRTQGTGSLKKMHLLKCHKF